MHIFKNSVTGTAYLLCPEVLPLLSNHCFPDRKSHHQRPYREWTKTRVGEMLKNKSHASDGSRRLSDSYYSELSQLPKRVPVPQRLPKRETPQGWTTTPTTGACLAYLEDGPTRGSGTARFKTANSVDARGREQTRRRTASDPHSNLRRRDAVRALGDARPHPEERQLTLRPDSRPDVGENTRQFRRKPVPPPADYSRNYSSYRSDRLRANTNEPEYCMLVERRSAKSHIVGSTQYFRQVYEGPERREVKVVQPAIAHASSMKAKYDHASKSGRFASGDIDFV